MPEQKRKTSDFQKLLLIVGFLVLIIGYFLINKVFIFEGRILSWGFLQAVFLWLLIVIFIVMLSIGEDIKESILLDQFDELKGLRKDINDFMRKKKS